ncbi:hypothetical protein C0J52_14776 [Blattella germanica]|nr:hypothetical protein C0J52_14776 [Blattella germanica]
MDYVESALNFHHVECSYNIIHNIRSPHRVAICHRTRSYNFNFATEWNLTLVRRRCHVPTPARCSSQTN